MLNNILCSHTRIERLDVEGPVIQGLDLTKQGFACAGVTEGSTGVTAS